MLSNVSLRPLLTELLSSQLEGEKQKREERKVSDSLLESLRNDPHFLITEVAQHLTAGLMRKDMKINHKFGCLLTAWQAVFRKMCNFFKDHFCSCLWKTPLTCGCLSCFFILLKSKRGCGSLAAELPLISHGWGMISVSTSLLSCCGTGWRTGHNGAPSPAIMLRTQAVQTTKE